MEDKLQIYYKILCINKESFSNIAELLHTDEFSVCNLDKNAQFSFICDNSALYISLFHHSDIQEIACIIIVFRRGVMCIKLK